MTKKVFGYIFITIAVILLIVAIARVMDLFATVYGIFKIFTGTLDSYGIGYVIGKLVFWVLHVLAMIALRNTGQKWIRKKKRFSETADTKEVIIDNDM